MKKFNEFEKYLMLEGLTLLAKQMKSEIEQVEKSGKRPLMTSDYVDVTMNELIEKINKK
jgi:hypothetical protein